jgi:hypothetical protein
MPETHTQFPQKLICPLAAILSNPLDPDLPDERIWYQHDGAPAHYIVIVRRYLEGSCPQSMDWKKSSN